MAAPEVAGSQKVNCCLSRFLHLPGPIFVKLYQLMMRSSSFYFAFSLCRLCVGVSLLAVACRPAVPPADTDYTTWTAHGGDPGSHRYSSLQQIHTGNVHQLQTAWTFHTGETDTTNHAQLQCNPIVVDGVMYVTSSRMKVFALNAATGKEIWQFDALSDPNASETNRGVTYWQQGDQKRILFTARAQLFSLDAATGLPVHSFGRNGVVDLREGLDRDVNGLSVVATTPGVVYGNLLILGSRVSEGPDRAAPGHIRAYDVETGKRAWIFHTIPHPGEYGYETWPADAWQSVGGANSWAGMSVDQQRGWVFVPTGSPTYDFYGGNRKGENLFGNCVLALDAATGKRIWHFQTVHHDLWDRDLPASPNLVMVEHEGKKVDAVAQITKTGFIFLLNRETGQPLFPVEERPVPPSDLGEEPAWPTQPFPLKPVPFARQTFTEADVTDRTPEARSAALERLRQIRSGRPFIPPSQQGTLIFPGFDGGGEWGGASFDPTTGILYVNSNEMPWILTMIERPDNRLASTGRGIYLNNCAGCHGADRQGEQHQFPALLNLQERLTRPQIAEIIRKGRGRMPAFQHLPEGDKQALVDYLLGIEKGSGPKPSSSSFQKVSKDSPQPPPYVSTGYHRFVDAEGYPAIKPPWGRLHAIDLNKGEILWQVPLGEFAELTQKGVAPTGTENYGGPITTAGGLLFIGATKDEKFRAFDKQTGKLLWERSLPAGGYATPCTYQVNGKQYVVIAAGGGKMGTRSGDAYVAFALP